jgi:large subunit ribosomal protein L30
MTDTIKVRQKASGIRETKRQNATLKGLGLGRPNKTRDLPDTPEVRGMIRKVSHLVEIVDDSE